jgi:hypothetical protein
MIPIHNRKRESKLILCPVCGHVRHMDTECGTCLVLEAK